MTKAGLFEILVHEHLAMLTAFARSLARRDDLADDLVQEAFLTAWKTLDRYDKSRPFAPWLRGIAAKLAMAQRRKRAQDWRAFDAEVLDLLDQRWSRAQSRGGDTLDDQLAALKECVDALPGPYREGLTLRYAEGTSVAALAEKLGIGLENLKKRLQRGLARLRECMAHKLEIEG